MTKLYLVDCDALRDEGLFSKYCALADGARRRKICALPDGEKKRRSLGAFAALCLALYRNSLAYGSWRESAGGKPYFEGGGAHFSLSHSGRYALCALSREGAVGCDIQHMRHFDERIAGRVMCKEELQKYLSLKEAAKESAEEYFYEVWTAKESFLKFTGEGLGGGMSGICLPARGEKLFAKGAPDGVYLAWFSPAAGYKAACCSLSPCAGTEDVTPLLGVADVHKIFG